MKKIIYIILSLVFSNTYAQYGYMSTKCTSAEVKTAYTDFMTKFYKSCDDTKGRIAWSDESNTVSEGIGYGMLYSAYNNDQPKFNAIWKYYQSFLNSHGLMHWKTSGCSSVLAQNAATDAELDVAAALIAAHSKWGSAGSVNYQADAKSMIAKIKSYEIEATTNTLKPGDFFGGSSLTNPSYFAPAYFKLFGEFTSDATFWNAVADKCYDVLNKNLSVNNAVGGLVSDWCKADGNYSSEAGGYVQSGKTYNYDACRTPWRIAVDFHWYNDPRAKAYLDKVNAFVKTTIGGIKNVKDGYYQNGTVLGQWHNNTYVGTFTCAGIAANVATVDDYYTELATLNPAWGGYFDYCFDLFAKMLISGGFKKPSTSVVIVPVTGVTISPTAKTIDRGQTAQLSFTISPSNATNKTVSYSSNNTAVATVSSNGLVTGIASGTCTIKVTTQDGNKTATCAVNVTNTVVLVTSITLTPATLSINKGQTSQLTTTVSPSNASNKSVTYSSSNTAVATVSPSGLVSAIAIGTATITVKTQDGNKTASCVVTVKTATSNLLTTYGVPRSTALPNVNNVAFNYIYVLGTGGPNLSNIANCTVNWSLTYNGLWQFSFQTKNGVPNWFNDLLPKITHTLNAASPAIKFTNSGFAGLDGDYWVNMHGSNLVLVGKSGAYAIYLSTSTTAPSGTLKSATALNTIKNAECSIYPNPAKDVVTVKLDNTDLNQISIFDLSGKEVLKTTVIGKSQVDLSLYNLVSGDYFVSIQGANGQAIKKLIVK